MTIQRILTGLMMISFLLPGCSQIKNLTNPLLGKKNEIVVCASTRIDQAYELYGEAKMKLAQHYDDRDSNHLLEAYYAASDSMALANTVAQCPDRQRSDFFAIKNLEGLNKSLQRVVRLNMRDEDPSNLIAIYRDQYYKVMPNDIR